MIAGTAPPVVSLATAVYEDDMYGMQRYGFTNEVKQHAVINSASGSSTFTAFKHQHPDENQATGTQYQVGDT